MKFVSAPRSTSMFKRWVISHARHGGLASRVPCASVLCVNRHCVGCAVDMRVDADFVVIEEREGRGKDEVQVTKL